MYEEAVNDAGRFSLDFTVKLPAMHVYELTITLSKEESDVAIAALREMASRGEITLKEEADPV